MIRCLPATVRPAVLWRRGLRRTLLIFCLFVSGWPLLTANAANVSDKATNSAETGIAPEPRLEPAPVPTPETANTKAKATAPADAKEGTPTLPVETAPAIPDGVQDMAAYHTSVRQHVEADPALAAAYLVFWSELKGGAAVHPDPADAAATARYFEELTALASTVSTEIGRQYGKDHKRFLVADVVKKTVATLSTRATVKLPGAKVDTKALAVSPEAERLLTNLDVLTRPKTTSEGRYRFSGTLRAVSFIGSSAEVWNLCKAVQACVNAHDKLFAPAMAGLSLIADAKRRLEGDLVVAESDLWKTMQPIASDMDAQLSQATTAEARDAVLKAAAAAHWKTVMQELPVTAGVKPPTTGQLPPDGTRLDALFSLGLAGAELAGVDKLANAFAIARKPALDFATLAAQGATSSSLLTSIAGVALVVAGVQAISLLDGDDAADQLASAQMRELITTLDARTYGALRDAASEQLLAINALDSRIAELGLALDVVKTDVARLESAGRKRIASNWQSETAKRWTAFDSENERCFSLRRRDPETQRLPRSDFRWCEERFLQGATQKARYANKSSEYAMDPRFADAADRDYPFHAHWPLLLTTGGMDQKQALGMSDPLEWQQYSAALLRLYREHPASPVEHAGRVETLQTLSAAGQRLHTQLQGLVLDPGKTTPAFRSTLHAQAFDEYLQALSSLAAHVEQLDDPAVHDFGKRMTAGFYQMPPAAGAKHTAIENALRRSVLGESGLKTCDGAEPSGFLPNRDRLTAEARRFFGSPITAGEVSAVWNRELINRLALDVDSLAGSIPAPWLWASLAELGSIEVCITRLRPESLSFTREGGSEKDTLKGSVILAADLEVRFLPHEDTAKTLGLKSGESLLLSQQTGGRACTFAYRNDEDGCSRAQCLADIAPTLWGTEERLANKTVRCSEEPLRTQLARAPKAAATGLEAKAEALAPLYWSVHAERIARIEADVLRSDQFIDASSAWLKYYALAGVTLGPWPEPAEFLADLFAADSSLAPREVVRTMLRRHVGSGTVMKPLRTQLDEVLGKVQARGKDLIDSGAVSALPHLAAIEDMLDRVELLEGFYATSTR